jgi:alkanesulfonate monooxygenase SsuD/methylene tetrahydromethanopterin reductase-like flavin-dependent oxidoreductase (luciferase family)
VNYGRPLQFGTFITPTSADPETPVALARLSERVGLDLVTFQDHPYRPALLDTCTLLAWGAGRTERAHLAANVLNVPLRQPAVLARSAASLDLLSGGRLGLALGAGASWDAIEAMGGRRLAPAESVAEELAELALDYGMSGLIRAADDAYSIELFASEVGPAAATRRRRTAAARTSDTGSSGVIRG